MSNYNISNRYAKALMQFAKEKNSLEQVSEDMLFLEKTLLESKDLKVVLKSPVISSDKKSAILNEIFASNSNKTSMEFILFVNKKNRSNILYDIAKMYNEIRNNKLNRVNAEVVSSVDLNDSQKSELINQLKSFSKMEIIPSYKTDESLIGGFTVKMNDTVIDASVKQQLIKLRKNLVSN
jgi:F-type H+-transporting ATPase subunit delta